MNQVDSDVVDRVRRALWSSVPVVVTGGRGSGRTTLLGELESHLPSSWTRVPVRSSTFDERDAWATDGSGRSLLVVDDLHLVPATARRRLVEAVDDGVSLLATTTEEAAVPHEIRSLLLEALRLDVQPADDEVLAEIAASALGAAPDDIGVALLARLTGRRPGLLRRVLQGARVSVAGDVAVVTDDVLTSDGALGWRRERITDPASHTLARLLARAEGLRRGQVAVVVGPDVIETALDRGLVSIEGDGLKLRDPLLHAVSGGPDRVTHGRSDAALLSDALGGEVDAAQRDLWDAEASRDLDAPARVAVVDAQLRADRPGLALRLAGSGDAAPALTLVRARALAAVGRSRDAAPLLRSLLDSDDEDIAALAAVRLADHRFFRESDPVSATELLAGVSSGRDEIVAEATALRAILQSVLGAAGRGSAEVPTTAATVRLVTDLRAVLAGRIEDVEDVATFDLDDSPAGLPLRERSMTNRAIAALHVDGVAAGHAATRAAVRQAMGSGRPGALALALSLRGQVEQLEGRLVEAERTLRAASLRAQVDDEAGLPELLRVLRGAVLAELGRLDEAATLLPSTSGSREDVRVRLLAAAGRVRVAAAADPGAAAEAVVDEIRFGIATGHHVWAVLAGLHAARVGLAPAVVDAVREASAGTVGLAVVAADAVQALAGDDPRARRAAARAAAEFGLRRIAAEMLSTVHMRPADHRRASVLLAGLGPPRPDEATATERLTPRELQVARAAAAGRTSRAIGEELNLSVRTIDNHLRRVYRKVGVSGRGELAAVLTGLE